jgi:hypothetical protein
MLIKDFGCANLNKHCSWYGKLTFRNVISPVILFRQFFEHFLLNLTFDLKYALSTCNLHFIFPFLIKVTLLECVVK